MLTHGCYRSLWLLIPLLACGCAQNCSSDSKQVVGLVVSARNSINGAPIAFPTITLSDGAYTEVMVPQDDTGTTFNGAVERAGTYTITIEKPGFQTTIVQNVMVLARYCHVETQTVTVNVPPS